MAEPAKVMFIVDPALRTVTGLRAGYVGGGVVSCEEGRRGESAERMGGGWRGEEGRGKTNLYKDNSNLLPKEVKSLNNQFDFEEFVDRISS